MPRSVNSVASRERRKKLMKHAKGYFGRRKNVWTVAKNAVEKGLTYAYRDRKNKKRTFRALWIQRINAGARLHGMLALCFLQTAASSNDVPSWIASGALEGDIDILTGETMSPASRTASLTVCSSGGLRSSPGTVRKEGATVTV